MVHISAIIPINGLQRLGVQASQSTAASGPSYVSTRHVQAMSVDDSTLAITTTNTAANGNGAIANFFAGVFDATPNATGAVISHTRTYTTAQANFTIARIILHDLSVPTSASASVVAGVDGQSFTKTSNFSVAITLTLQYTDAST